MLDEAYRSYRRRLGTASTEDDGEEFDPDKHARADPQRSDTDDRNDWGALRHFAKTGARLRVWLGLPPSDRYRGQRPVLCKLYGRIREVVYQSGDVEAFAKTLLDLEVVEGVGLGVIFEEREKLLQPFKGLHVDLSDHLETLLRIPRECIPWRRALEHAGMFTRAEDYPPDLQWPGRRWGLGPARDIEEERRAALRDVAFDEVELLRRSLRCARAQGTWEDGRDWEDGSRCYDTRLTRLLADAAETAGLKAAWDTFNGGFQHIEEAARWLLLDEGIGEVLTRATDDPKARGENYMEAVWRSAAVCAHGYNALQEVLELLRYVEAHAEYDDQRTRAASATNALVNAILYERILRFGPEHIQTQIAWMDQKQGREFLAMLLGTERAEKLRALAAEAAVVRPELAVFVSWNEGALRDVNEGALRDVRRTLTLVPWAFRVVLVVMLAKGMLWLWHLGR